MDTWLVQPRLRGFLLDARLAPRERDDPLLGSDLLRPISHCELVPRIQTPCITNQMAPVGYSKPR